MAGTRPAGEHPIKVAARFTTASPAVCRGDRSYWGTYRIAYLRRADTTAPLNMAALPLAANRASESAARTKRCEELSLGRQIPRPASPRVRIDPHRCLLHIVQCSLTPLAAPPSFQDRPLGREAYLGQVVSLSGAGSARTVVHGRVSRQESRQVRHHQRTNARERHGCGSSRATGPSPVIAMLGVHFDKGTSRQVDQTALAQILYTDTAEVEE